MKVTQKQFGKSDWQNRDGLKECDLTFAFGDRNMLESSEFRSLVADKELGATTIGCSTCGEIWGDSIYDGTVVATGLKFDHPQSFTKVAVSYAAEGSAFDCGKKIAEAMRGKDLQLLFVLSKGTDINGSDVINGIESVQGKGVPITGGLAGDNANFERTIAFLDDQFSDDLIVAIGFEKSEHLRVGYASRGGWKPFGPPRQVTRSEGNILFEIDGESALSIYEKYLGDKAQDLPSAGLFYPFAIVNDGDRESGLIRTILGVDKEQGSLTLAGDMPNGATVRLMHSDNEGIIDGARTAAKDVTKQLGDVQPGLGVLVSCIGRKLTLGVDTEDEIDAVREGFPEGAHFTGFYSHGEICPTPDSNQNKLHNQTMTITYFSES